VVLDAYGPDAECPIRGCDMELRPNATVCNAVDYTNQLRPVLADILQDIAPKVTRHYIHKLSC
jgi:hypothetical protein